MPAPQLHLTFGEHLGQTRMLAPDLRAASVAEPQYTRLGAIFHDLPYYGNMPLMAVRYGLRRPAEESFWGNKLHYDRPDEFLARFVENARTFEGSLSRSERLALIAGFASHVALDLSLHPLVNYLARRDQQIEGGPESHHHRLAEKYHAMFYHLDVAGRDLIGSREIIEKTRVTKRSSLVRRAAEPDIVDFSVGCYHAMWSQAPSAGQFRGWIRSFSQFGVMVGSRMALRNSLRLRTSANRDRYFRSKEFNFYDFWEVGQARGISIANRCFEYYEREDFSSDARGRFISEVAFDGSLAEPEGRDGPALPKLAPGQAAA